MSKSILAPSLPQEPRSFVFPTVAAVAPIVMGVALWLFTQQVLGLLFGALGPVIAIGSFADSVWQARRLRRRERARFHRESDEAHGDIAVAHDEERRELDRSFPSATAIVGRAVTAGEGWARSGPPLVRIGLADQQSSLEIAGMPPASRSPTAEHIALEQFRAQASTLRAAPFAVEIATGIGVVGPPVLVAAVVRALCVQLAWQLRPDEWSIVASTGTGEWITRLPHEVSAGEGAAEVRFARRKGGAIVVAAASSATLLPIELDVVVHADAPWKVNRALAASTVDLVEIDRVSAAEALEWAETLAARARELSIGSGGGAVPAKVLFSSLDHSFTRATVSAGVRARVGVSSDGPFVIDLVADGPHAVIGGTTGSGKSELLISWVLAMAINHSPSELCFLLIDFKGGASFGPLGPLKHCVGLLTDLDPSTARRALLSLEAELRHRESVLATSGSPSIDSSHGLARLVIVVDEFATVAHHFPELANLFADIAARGRSLGMHLILCTQRPAGVVRDNVLANIAIRVSLRVHDRADSSAVIGVPDAAGLEKKLAGRALVILGDGAVRPVQWALTTHADIASIASAVENEPEPRRPWLDPLPAMVRPCDLSEAGEARAIGLLDLPHDQAQPTASWSPGRDGNVLILGSAGSGKTVAMSAIREGPAVRADPIAAWVAVVSALARVRGKESHPTVVAIDDIDVVLARLSPDHASALAEALIALCREGPARGTVTVLSALSLPSSLHSLASLSPSKLLLKLSDRNEHALAGGAIAQFDPKIPPGRGWWRGDSVQIALTEIPDAAAAPPPQSLSLASERTVAIVSSRTREFIETALSTHPNARIIEPADSANHLTVSSERAAPTLIVSDVEGWNSRWGSLAALTGVVPILFDECSVADFRSLTRSRELPPPLGPGELWLLSTDRTVTRGRVE